MSTARESCLRILQYSSPFAIIFCTILLSTVSACFTPPSKRTVLQPSQRMRSKWIALAITTLYALEGTLYGLRKLLQAGWVAEEGSVVYASLCFLIWIIISLVQADAINVTRLPNIGIWALAGLLEVAICLVQWPFSTTSSFEYCQLAILFARIISLVSLCVYNLSTPRRAAQRDLERTPLLHDASETTSVDSAENDIHHKEDTAPDDESEDGNAKYYERRHRQRVERLGSLWRYLQEVKFLVPHIVPTRDFRLQLYAFGMLVLMLCDRASNILGPRLLGNLVDKINKMKVTDEFPWRDLCIFIFVVKIPHDVVLAPARRWLSFRLYYWSYRSLLHAAFSHVMGLSLVFHDNKQTGEVQAAINQAGKVNQFVDDFGENIFPLFLDIVVAFGYITYLFDVYVSLMLATTYVAYGVVTYKGTFWVARACRRLQSTRRFERNFVYEAIANWMSAFYFNRQGYQRSRLEATSKQEAIEALCSYDFGQIMYIFQSLVMCLGYCAVLFRTAYISAGKDRAVGDFVAFLLFWPIFTTPLYRLAHAYNRMVVLFVELERLLEITQTEPSVTDAEGAKDLVFKGGKVEYRNVSFSYDGKNAVIKNLNFVVSPGSTVAFVGQTGSGKTTTCDKLLFRGYDVTKGAVLIDDQDIRNVTQWSLREMLGIVRQEQSFYNDSVLEIVRFARLDATDEEVYEACMAAAIHEQIMAFPNSYHSKIGERGVKLSGGERQRIGIAQLFLRNPKIVVLDEATSTVDNITESEIQESFARICKGRTTFIIAHRLSTVQHADQIFVLDKGTIVERGTHDELLGLKGRYYRLWHKKKAVDRLEDALKQCKSTTEENVAPLIDLSSDNDDSDCSSIADISQVDGAGSSKPSDDSNTARTGVRKRIHDFKERVGGSKKRDSEEDYEVDEEDDVASPIRVVSPRATDATPPSALPSRSFSLRKRSRGAKSGSTSPTPLCPTRAPTTPLSPTRAPTQQLTAFRPVRTQSGIPVNVTPLSSPTRARQESAIGTRAVLPQSPGREAALNSHPVVTTTDEDVDGPLTDHPPGTSIGSRKDVSQDHE